MSQDSAPFPSPIAWSRAARVIARGTPLYDVAAALRVPVEVVERKLADDPHYAELVAYRKERRKEPEGERLAGIREGFIDELEHALDTGSVRGLGWMSRELRLGLQLTDLAGRMASAGKRGAAGRPGTGAGPVFHDWETPQPDDDPGGPDRQGTHSVRFLASLCDIEYEEYRAAGGSPYPARRPPLPHNLVRFERAQAAMRGEAVPAMTPEELCPEPEPLPDSLLDELEIRIDRAAEAGMAPLHPRESGAQPPRAGTHASPLPTPTRTPTSRPSAWRRWRPWRRVAGLPPCPRPRPMSLPGEPRLPGRRLRPGERSRPRRWCRCARRRPCCAGG